MNVSWFWIKQRPQFLAEEISAYYPVTVVCLEDHNEGEKVKKLNVKGRLSFIAFNILRSGLGTALVSHFNFRFRKFKLGRAAKKHSIIWLTSPSQFALAKSLITKKQLVIYDCMDNATAFHDSEPVINKIFSLEAALCERADLIITSADFLKRNLEHNYKVEKNIAVVNNALQPLKISVDELPAEIKNLFSDNSKKYVTYIGTVSRWFNFDDLVEALNPFPSIQVIIFGPIDCPVPNHIQISYAGIIKHALVSEVMQLSDALIMPFKITPLVQGVNPVKAYEYISSGKPVILSMYNETRAFEKFAHLYENAKELETLFSLLMTDKLMAKEDKETCTAFANNNTWHQRAFTISGMINMLLEKR